MLQRKARVDDFSQVPLRLCSEVMAGDFMQIQSASVLFSMVNAQGRSFAKEAENEFHFQGTELSGGGPATPRGDLDR